MGDADAVIDGVPLDESDPVSDGDTLGDTELVSDPVAESDPVGVSVALRVLAGVPVDVGDSDCDRVDEPVSDALGDPLPDGV